MNVPVKKIITALACALFMLTSVFGQKAPERLDLSLLASKPLTFTVEKAMDQFAPKSIVARAEAPRFEAFRGLDDSRVVEFLDRTAELRRFRNKKVEVSGRFKFGNESEFIAIFKRPLVRLLDQ